MNSRAGGKSSRPAGVSGTRRNPAAGGTSAAAIISLLTRTAQYPDFVYGFWRRNGPRTTLHFADIGGRRRSTAGSEAGRFGSGEVATPA
jgi:hypothetical protein